MRYEIRFDFDNGRKMSPMHCSNKKHVSAALRKLGLQGSRVNRLLTDLGTCGFTECFATVDGDACEIMVEEVF